MDMTSGVRRKLRHTRSSHKVCHPDRSAAEWRDLVFQFLASPRARLRYVKNFGDRTLVKQLQEGNRQRSGDGRAGEIHPVIPHAPAPASVPTKVIPPSVPAGTPSKVVIRWALSLCACPHSLETVSAAASASAAAIAVRKYGLPRQANIAAHTVAIPRFARTCEAVRPSPRSAVPSSSLRARPIRVANHVTANREKSAANAPGPAQANRTRQTMPPAIAPVRDTPRTICPTPAKATVTTRMKPKRSGVVAHELGDISAKYNAINCIADFWNGLPSPRPLESNW